MVLQIWSGKQHPQASATSNQSIHTVDNSNAQEENGRMPGSSTQGNTNANMGANGNEIAKTPTKKRGLSLFKSKLLGGGGSSSGKAHCKTCKKKCSGEVLRVNEFYFHSQCFRCKGCSKSLSQGGFFTKSGDYYCASCYQKNFGTKCTRCGLYVEGEVVTALGKTYHQNCFTCAGCREPFPTGERVTFTGKACLCQKCVKAGKDLDNALEDLTNSIADIKTTKVAAPSSLNNSVTNGRAPAMTATQPATGGTGVGDDICAGCSEELRDGQALVALDKQYHVWCFKCKACNALLHGEYMGKDGHPYCERDYQQLFGVKCTYCRRFISGKVLQAGDNNHFHPTCARCTKCGEPFGDGEEMFLQGAAIWHPRCGPGPDENGGVFISNGFENSGMDAADRASVASGTFYGYSRASSPGASLRYGYETPGGGVDGVGGHGSRAYSAAGGRFSRSTTHVPGWGPYHGGHGMYSSSSTYSLRRPIEPGDRIGSMASINHFHVPPHARRGSSVSRYARESGMATPVHPQASTDQLSASQHHRPISCPPKPGYTHAMRASTLPTGFSTSMTPGPGMNYNDDGVSQASFRTDMTDQMAGGFIRGSSTYSHGFYPGTSRSLFNSGRDTPTSAIPGAFSGEYKIYPLHMLFTNNYKIPPDVDRCNLEKHLSDADFAMAFNMPREDFYRLPKWRRNDLKKRLKLF